jgi:hypothetical protein
MNMGLLAQECHMIMLFAYSQEKMMQHVGAGLVAIQGATRMRPPDPESVAAAVVIHAAPGSEAAAKYLLFKLDSMQAQVATLLLCSLIMFGFHSQNPVHFFRQARSACCKKIRHSLVRHQALLFLSTCLEGLLCLAQLTLSMQWVWPR